MEAEFRYFLPKNGVYSVTLKVHSTDEIHKGVGNICVKPTFHDDITKPIIEVHLYDFNESIYGESVTIYFHHYIRGEEKFDGVDRKSTRLNSSHVAISYAVFCLKKKKE